MTAQNIYDDPEFLAGYVTLDRQVHGLDGAAEWPVLRSFLPDMDGRRTVDLGCGFGWFSRWADEHGAASVLGIDVSTKMLERARCETTSPTIDYQASTSISSNWSLCRRTSCSVRSRCTTCAISTD